jgi:IclR family KDG regulon transcriptional repressor
LSESVRTVDRALDILLCFTQKNSVLSLTEISEKVGINKSTVHRLLATLEGKRFLIRHTATGKYHLGYRFLEMSSGIMSDIRHQWAYPYLERLANDCGETVDLAILDGDAVVYLHVIESQQRVKIAAAIGQRLPVHCTATGKAFLAYLPVEKVKVFLANGLSRYTEHTLIDLDDLYEDLCETRRRGFAISKEEYEKDIHSVAAPILAMEGYPILAIAIAGPSFRLPQERMLMLGHTIQSTIETIRQEVGLIAISVMIPKGDGWK